MAGILLIAGEALAGCSKNSVSIEKNPVGEKYFTLSVNAGFDTKALADPGDGTLTVTWEVGDSVSVYNLTTGEPAEGYLLTVVIKTKAGRFRPAFFISQE